MDANVADVHLILWDRGGGFGQQMYSRLGSELRTAPRCPREEGAGPLSSAKPPRKVQFPRLTDQVMPEPAEWLGSDETVSAFA